MNLKTITAHGNAIDFVTTDKTFTFTPEDEPSTVMPILNFLTNPGLTQYESGNYGIGVPTVLRKSGGQVYVVMETENVALGTEAEVVRALADAFFADPNPWVIRNYQTYQRHGEKGEAKIAEILALPETQDTLQRTTEMLRKLTENLCE